MLVLSVSVCLSLTTVSMLIYTVCAEMNVSEAAFVGDLVAMAVNGSSIILDGQELQRLTGTTSGEFAWLPLLFAGLQDDA